MKQLKIWRRIKMVINLFILFVLLNINSPAQQSDKQCFLTTKNQELFFYLDVDELPKFSYNNLSAVEYIYNNIKWPDDFDGQGTVIVSFTVNENGRTSDVRIEKSLFHKCNNEVVKVISEMPRWIPAKRKNKNVNVVLLLPITFRLD